ncbi:MAG TPA: hypothetical protein VF855_03975 [Acidimicrobiales bacterium]
MRAKLAVLAALTAGLGLLLAAPASAKINGPCTGSATITGDGGETVKLDPATSEGPYVVPASGSADYEGTITGVPAGKQAYFGQVVLQMPPPFSDIVIKDWSGETELVTKKGTETYDLPSFVPKGVEMPLSAAHAQGGVACSTNVVVKIDGSALNPYTIATGALAAITAAGFLGSAVPPLVRRPKA